MRGPAVVFPGCSPANPSEPNRQQSLPGFD
jgi:hypothetical protein